MHLRHLIHDDDAVSPVIGVILMVAIAVILSAVIATFALGFGDSIGSSAPQVTFDYQYDGSTLTITHAGGDGIDEDKVGIRGGASDVGPGFNWDGTSDTTVTAGESYDYSAASSDSVRIVWRAGPGGSTAILGAWEGPDA